LISGAILIPKSSDPNHTKIDIPGSVLSVVGLVAIVYAIIEAPHNGWLSFDTLSVFSLGAAAMGLFVWWELKTKHPMLDVRLFKIKAFGVSALVLTLVFFALMGMFFNMSQLTQLVWGYSPLEAALKMLPMSAAIVVSSIMSPKLVQKFGKRKVVGSGMLIVALGVLLLSTLGIDVNYGMFVLQQQI